MEINRAQELAKEYGYKLTQGVGYDWELHKNGPNYTNQYIDTLHLHQIGVLLEEDFIEFYLND